MAQKGAGLGLYKPRPFLSHPLSQVSLTFITPTNTSSICHLFVIDIACLPSQSESATVAHQANTCGYVLLAVYKYFGFSLFCCFFDTFWVLFYCAPVNTSLWTNTVWRLLQTLVMFPSELVVPTLSQYYLRFVR